MSINDLLFAVRCLPYLNCPNLRIRVTCPQSFLASLPSAIFLPSTLATSFTFTPAHDFIRMSRKSPRTSPPSRRKRWARAMHSEESRDEGTGGPGGIVLPLNMVGAGMYEA